MFADPVFSFLIFTVLVIAIALASYGIARWTLRGHANEDTRELASSALFRVAALHGLVLALVFAQDLARVKDVSKSAAEEATILSDVFHDAARYSASETAELRGSLARYGQIVVDEEWSLLAEHEQLSPDAWVEWESAYEMLLDLVPSTPRQERLLEIMIEDIRAVSALRDARENAAIGTSIGLFLWAALAGVVLVSAAYFTWPATALNLGLIAMFSAYTALILYMVVAFSNPFSAPGRASTAGFERFLTPEVRDIAAVKSGVPAKN